MNNNRYCISGGKIDKRNNHLINEDKIIAKDNYLIVIDGATGLGNIELDENLTSAEWYVKNLAVYLQMELDAYKELEANNIKEIVKKSISKMKNLVKQKETELNITLERYNIPSCCLTIFYKTKDKIIIFSLGDNSVLIKHKNKNELEIISDPIHNNFDNRVFKLMRQIAKDNNITIKEARKYKEINELLIKNREKMNTKDGYYIISIDDKACNHAYLKEFNTNEIEKIFICSDGFDFEILDITTEEFMTLVNNENISIYIDEIITKLKQDTNWEKYNKRFKDIDDITAYVAYKK